jgi:hypothetical protein
MNAMRFIFGLFTGLLQQGTKTYSNGGKYFVQKDFHILTSKTNRK